MLSQAQALTTLGSEPLVVLTAAATQDRPAAHDRMAKLSTNSSHRFADGVTHVGLLDEEGGAQVTSNAIEDVVAAVRSSSQVPQR